MAATNYTPIQLYYSTTASAAPVAGNLASGELAINITDGKLYYKDNGGVVQVIATKGAGTIGGSDTQIQYNNAGALAGNAAMTFNSGTSTVTLTTLNLTNALGAAYGGTAQSTYTQGDILYSSATNTLAKLGIGTTNYILTSTGSVPQWTAPTSIVVQTATNLAGGAAGSVPYQSAADTTTFLAIGTANRVMTSSGTAPQWVTSLSGLTGVSSSSITNTSLTSGRVVLSSTGGLQADDADLTFDGTTLSAGGLSTTGFSTQVKTVTIGNSNFNGVAVFAPSTPAKLYVGTGTVTDVTSAAAATNTTGAIASLAITPIAATNANVTYTNAATLYIAGAPSAGTNVTLTNPYSLYIAAGDAYFGGAVVHGGNLDVTGNLTVDGNTTLGDASTDTVTVNGYMGVGGAVTNASRAINIGNSALTGTTQRGLHSNITGTSGATSAIIGVSSFPIIEAAAFTVADVMAFQVGTVSKGAGSTITNQHGLYISDQTQGTNNYGITSLVSSGTNKWNIYASGTAANYFAGNVGIGTSSPSSFGLSLERNGDVGITLKNQADVSGNTWQIWQDNYDGTLVQNNILKVTYGSSDLIAAKSFEVVINETSGDVDFRVESDTNTHALFVDAGLNRVGVNKQSLGGGSGNTEITGLFQIGSAASTTAFMITSGVDYAGLKVVGGATNASGNVDFWDFTFRSSYVAGVSGVGDWSAIRIDMPYAGQQAVVINEGSEDIDFRVESDSNTHMLFVDAGNDVVVVANSTSNAASGTKLAVQGSVSVGNRLASNASATYSLELSGYAVSDGTARYGSYGALNFYANESYTGSARQYLLTNAYKANNFAIIRGNTSGGTTPYIGTFGAVVDGKVFLSIDDSDELVINEEGVDIDFRVESDTNTHMLFVDAGSNAVGIGTSSTTGWSSYTPLIIGSTNLSLASTGASSTFSQIVHAGYYNGSNWIQSYTDVTVARHEMVGNVLGSSHNFYTANDVNVDTATTQILNLTLKPSEAVFNEDSRDIDFRVESDTNTHAFFVDAGNNRIGFSDSAPDTAWSLSTNNTSATGNMKFNEVKKAAIQGQKNASTAVTVRCWFTNYSSAMITFMYAHTNGGDGFSFAQIAVGNAFGTMFNQTVASKLTNDFASPITFTANTPTGSGGNNYVYFTMPTGNGSPGYYTITVEGVATGAGAGFWFEIV